MQRRPQKLDLVCSLALSLEAPHGRESISYLADAVAQVDVYGTFLVAVRLGATRTVDHTETIAENTRPRHDAGSVSAWSGCVEADVWLCVYCIPIEIFPFTGSMAGLLAYQACRSLSTPTLIRYCHARRLLHTAPVGNVACCLCLAVDMLTVNLYR
jgi:hypothetical protein